MSDISRLSIKKRLFALIALIAFIFVALIGKLIYIQLVSGGNLRKMALNQWTRDLPLGAERGLITDVNGVILADSVTKYSIYARPSALEDKKHAASVLSAELNVPYDKMLEKISKRGVSEITVAKGVDRVTKLAVQSQKPKGIYYATEGARYYPYGDFLSQILGFTNVDGKGQTGIENYHNVYLTGHNGKILTDADIVGKELENGDVTVMPAIAGMDVKLTVDYYVQSFAEKAVREAMYKYSARAASCLIMNSTTGEIKAMSQAPSFDLNNVPRDDIDALMANSKNSMISNVFEPGSTFKILTTAIGMEEGVIKDSDRFFCPGYRMIAGERIKCWRSQGHGSQTLAEGIRNSCNCVFMDIATRVGKDKMYEYFDAFNIKGKTGVDMIGEGGGLMLNKSIVREVDIARIGFGQAIAVTPIGLASSVSAVINGGNSIRPYVTKDIFDKDYGSAYEKNVFESKSIVSGGTSGKLVEYLFGVVESGSGKKAYVPGYKIGGKTGTAQKYENGAIAQGKYVSSFIGFTDIGGENYVCLMLVDEPQGYQYYGSLVAAPYVGEIFMSMFSYYGEKPEYTENDLKELGKRYVMPNLIGMSVKEANALLYKMGVPYEISGEGGVIGDQVPVAGANCDYNTVALLLS